MVHGVRTMDGVLVLDCLLLRAPVGTWKRKGRKLCDLAKKAGFGALLRVSLSESKMILKMCVIGELFPPNPTAELYLGPVDHASRRVVGPAQNKDSGKLSSPSNLAIIIEELKKRSA